LSEEENTVSESTKSINLDSNKKKRDDRTENVKLSTEKTEKTKSASNKYDSPNKKPEASTPRKKAGRPVGASGYSASDLIGILDAVEAILSIMDSEWVMVEEYFMETYAKKFDCPVRNDVGLKAKFRSLCHGPATGGGERSKYEERAKKIQRKIQDKSGMIVSHNEPDEEFLEVSSSSSSPARKRMKTSTTGRTRMKFETEILSAIRSDAEEARRRHEEKMDLLKTIFLGGRSSTSRNPLSPPSECFDESDY
jgi:hypothetical protein